MLHYPVCGHIANIIFGFSWLGLLERDVILLSQTLWKILTLIDRIIFIVMDSPFQREKKP